MARRRRLRPKLVLGDIVGFVALVIIFSSVILSILNARSSFSGDTVQSKNTDTQAVLSKKTEKKVAKPRVTVKKITPSYRYPSDLLNLTNWKLTIPVNTSHEGTPDEITQPELASYNSDFFHLNSDKNAVVFKGIVNGDTTAHSHYPRSELREMTDNGLNEASWSDDSGTHIMEYRLAITHLPAKKSEVVAGQIHDESDDVVMIRLEKNHLFVEADGDEIGDLDKNYQLGNIFSVKIVAENGHIKVYYNGKQKVDYEKSGDGYYFKAGCYTQSNLSKGEKSGDYGEVQIYSLQVSHRD